MKLAIIIPAYNEEKRIGRTLERYAKFFNGLEKNKNINYVILVVINGTTDNTERIIQRHQKKYENIRYLNLKQGGKGFAITEGFKEACRLNFELIGFVDADLATSPEEYWKMIEQVRDYDGAIADRYIKGARIIGGFGFRRLVVSRIFNLLVRGLFGLSYRDTQCGAKVFKRKVIEKIVNELTTTQWAFDVNLLYECKKNKFKIASVPTIWYEAPGSKLNINKASVQMLFAILQLRILQSPLRKSLKVLKPIINPIYKTVK